MLLVRKICVISPHPTSRFLTALYKVLVRNNLRLVSSDFDTLKHEVPSQLATTHQMKIRMLRGSQTTLSHISDQYDITWKRSINFSTLPEFIQLIAMYNPVDQIPTFIEYHFSDKLLQKYYGDSFGLISYDYTQEILKLHPQDHNHHSYFSTENVRATQMTLMLGDMGSCYRYIMLQDDEHIRKIINVSEGIFIHRIGYYKNKHSFYKVPKSLWGEIDHGKNNIPFTALLHDIILVDITDFVHSGYTSAILVNKNIGGYKTLLTKRMNEVLCKKREELQRKEENYSGSDEEKQLYKGALMQALAIQKKQMISSIVEKIGVFEEESGRLLKTSGRKRLYLMSKYDSRISEKTSIELREFIKALNFLRESCGKEIILVYHTENGNKTYQRYLREFEDELIALVEGIIEVKIIRIEPFENRHPILRIEKNGSEREIDLLPLFPQVFIQ